MADVKAATLPNDNPIARKLKNKFPHHTVLIDCAFQWREKHDFQDVPLEPLVRFAAEFRHNCTDANCPGGIIERRNREIANS